MKLLELFFLTPFQISLYRLFAGIFITVVMLFYGKIANAGASSPDQALSVACKNVSDERKYTIKLETDNEGRRVYICSVIDGGSIYGGDCYQSPEGGTISIHKISDLNDDNLKDIITKNHVRGEDVDDIKAFMGFANCGGGVYLKLDIGYFTDIVPIQRTIKRKWLNLKATRKCYNKDEKKPRIQVRAFTLTFDEKSFKYISSNTDLNSTEYCSDKELSAPFEREEIL